MSNGGSVSVDLLQNIYDTGGVGVNLTYTFRNQLNFNHPLSVSDGGYYICNVSVELTYPDKSTVKLSNVTFYLLIIEGKQLFVMYLFLVNINYFLLFYCL